MPRLSFPLLFASSFGLLCSLGGGHAAQFNPRSYSKHTAACKAVRRAPSHEVVNITLSYVEINPDAGTTMLMVHGWPGLWSTWSNQIEEFKNEYHLIVPDLRGFGQSTHPGDVRSSGTMGDLAGDLVCILEQANVKSAICVGHDWGTQTCYEAARMRPDIFTSVVGITIPYIPVAGDFVPMKQLAAVFPTVSYQLFLDTQTSAAIAELDRDIRRSVRSTLRDVASPPPAGFLSSTESYLGAWATVDEIPPIPFFTPDEEDYFVEQYSRQGFQYTLQFYMTENRIEAWELAHKQGNFTIPQPALSILPTQDPVADWDAAAKVLKSADFLPQLTTELVKGAHWVQLENPQRVNAAIRQWLQKTGVGNKDGPGSEPRLADEL